MLPAGPTVTDVVANAAFYYGLVRALADEPRPVWTRLPFEAAAANFDAACRYGIDAAPAAGRGRAAAGGPTERVRRAPRPGRAAAAGRGRAGRLGRRARRPRPATSASSRSGAGAGPNGASWQAAAFHRALGSGLDREAALAATTRRYCELMHSRGTRAHLAGAGLSRWRGGSAWRGRGAAEPKGAVPGGGPPGTRGGRPGG